MPWNADSVTQPSGGILLLLLRALLATWVKPSRGISARNPQAFHLRPAPCMRQGCRQAANWKRARHSRRATKTCRNEDNQRQADTIGSRAPCVPPHGCCVLSAPRLQVHSHRCQLAGRKLHTHWLHVYRCSQTRLKAYRCPPASKHAGAHRPGSRCTGARRPGSGHAGARRPGSRCNHAGTSRPGSRRKLAGAYHRPGSSCAGAIRAIRMGSGSVYTYPPPVTQPNPWAHKASHSQRPGPKSGVSSWLKILAALFTGSHSVRVPSLSAGAGGSSTFVHAVSQQVLKQAEIQCEIPSFIGNQVLLTPFVVNCQTLPRVSLSQTPRSFRFLQIPDACLAADHRYLVPNADRKLAAATYPILGWDGPHWVPAPRMLRDVVWILTRASLQVTVSMCEKAVFRRCSAARLKSLEWA